MNSKNIKNKVIQKMTLTIGLCSKSWLLLLLVLCLFLNLNTLYAKGRNPYTETGLRWPLDASRRLTSSFCESRPDRFHAGMDFSTRGSVGYPCFAIADGYIFRIKTSFNGYGKVLYLKWGKDRIAVYAHLSGFDERIEAVVREEQKRTGSYQVEMYFAKGELEYKQGDVIAYTGDTGAGAPHLHFELRHGVGTPYNPSLEGFKVPDKRRPVIRRVAIRPLDGESEVNGDMVEVVRSINNGVASPVDIYGRVGVSVEARDWQDGGWHRLGVQKLELYLNGELLHRTSLDSFKYRNNRDARLDFDYELWRNGYKRFRRLYVVDGNRLSFYDKSLPGGVIDSRKIKSGENTLEIVAIDDGGNISRTTWTINSRKNPVLPSCDNKLSAKALTGEVEIDENLSLDLKLSGSLARFYVSNVPEWVEVVRVRSTAFKGECTLIPKGKGRWLGRCNIPVDFRGTCEFIVIAKRPGKTISKNITTRLGGFKSGTKDRWAIPEAGVELRIGEDEIWFDMVSEMRLAPMESDKVAPIYHFFPHEHPFHKPITIALTASDVPWDSSAVIVYQEKGEDRWRYLGHEREMNGFVLKADVYSFEKFSVMLDTIPPVVGRLSLKENTTTKLKRPRLAASMFDVLSGLDYSRCQMKVDGKNVIWVYDPDAKTISYRPWEDLRSGKHNWEIVSVDRVGNKKTVKRTFRIK